MDRVLPFGYQFTESTAGKGKKLAQDPEYSALLREIVDRVKTDWSAYRIAVDLNRRKVSTWRDYLRIKSGKPPRGIQWTSATIVAIVTNPTAAGFFTYKGEQVEDEEGNPVMISSNPIMTSEEWNQMVVRFTTDERKAVRSTPSRSMLGVWAEKDDDQKRAFLKKHNIRVVVFRDLVEWSKESVVVEFLDLKEVIQVNNLQLDDPDYYRTDFDTPSGDDGSAIPLERLTEMAKSRIQDRV